MHHRPRAFGGPKPAGELTALPDPLAGFNGWDIGGEVGREREGSPTVANILPPLPFRELNCKMSKVVLFQSF